MFLMLGLFRLQRDCTNWEIFIAIFHLRPAWLQDFIEIRFKTFFLTLTDE